MNKVTVLSVGYSHMLPNDSRGDVMKANCTCTLIQCVSGHNIIIDTLDAWSGKKLLETLKLHQIDPNTINYCISTHEHVDHTGNNNLFLMATHIVGRTISKGDEYFLSHDFAKYSFRLSDTIEIIPTQGHTSSCVSVICKNSSFDGKTVAIVGDLFENENDIDNSSLWIQAGSQDSKEQMKNRYKIAKIADYIVPGHGPMFQVTDEMREKLYKQVSDRLFYDNENIPK